MKADVSIKWSERAADCPLVEEKSCGLCFWTKPRGLSMTGTLVWGSLMMKSTALLHVHVWLTLVQSSSSQVNLAAFFSRRLSVSEVWSRFRLSCWCLARTSRRFLRFSHESVSAGLWKNHQHQTSKQGSNMSPAQRRLSENSDTYWTLTVATCDNAVAVLLFSLIFSSWTTNQLIEQNILRRLLCLWCSPHGSHR